MNWQQIATLVILLLILGFSYWAWREALANHRASREKKSSKQQV
jgi:protein-S-isoprenylcysteine O-methyltransferase Ste14